MLVVYVLIGNKINALNDLPYRVMNILFSFRIIIISNLFFYEIQWNIVFTPCKMIRTKRVWSSDTQIKREFIDFIYRSIISTQILLICKHVFHIRWNSIVKHILKKKECSRSPSLRFRTTKKKTFCSSLSLIWIVIECVQFFEFFKIVDIKIIKIKIRFWC